MKLLAKKTLEDPAFKASIFWYGATGSQKESLDFLSTEEAAYVGRASHPTVQNQRIATSLALRLFLNSPSFELRREASGQPFIFSADKGLRDERNLSVSHKDEFVALGLSKRRIGIDLEIQSPRHDFSRLEKYVLSQNEIENLNLFKEKTGAESREMALLASWTLKEAFAKALGCDFEPSKIEIDSTTRIGFSRQLENVWTTVPIFQAQLFYDPVNLKSCLAVVLI